MNVKSLVDEIKTCLRNGAPENEVLRLGVNYLEAHNTATTRLQRCVDLIRQDKKSTALQEAMFSPPLMVVLEALSFSQQKQWSDALSKVGMMAPASLDSKQLALMGKLFSEPIDGSDPLYEDLAHAMRTKDAELALSILRLIRQKNPSDRNAKDQLIKIESSVQDGQIKALLSLIEEGNDKAFSADFSRFEMEPWELTPEGTDWNKVDAHNQDIIKAENLEHSKSMILDLMNLRKKDDFANAEKLISQIDSIISANGFTMEEELDDSKGKSYHSVLESIRGWIKQEALKAKRKEEDKSRESQLKIVIRSIQDKELGRKRRTNELRSDLAKLTSVGRDLEQAGQSLKEEDLNNFNRCLIKLRQEIAKRQKHLRILATCSCLALAALAGVSFYFISERLRWNEQYNTLIEGLDKYKNAELLEEFVNSFVKNNSERIKDVEFETEINKARNFISEARSYNTKFGENVQGVLQQLEGAKDLKSISQIMGRKKLLWEELNQVNPAYLNSRQDQLREIDLIWNSKRDNIQAEISDLISKKLDHLATFQESRLDTNQESESLESNLNEFNLLLVDAEREAKKYSKIDGIGLTSGQKDLLTSFRTTYDKKKELLVKHNELVAELPQKDSVETLLNCLDEIIRVGITGSAEFKASQDLLRLRNRFNDIEGRRFMPRTPQLWQSALGSINSKYLPEKVLPNELGPINMLLDEERTINICSVAFFSSNEYKRFEKNIDNWEQVEPENNHRIWTVGRKYDYTLTLKPGRGLGSHIMEQKAKVISGDKVTEKIFKSEWTGIGQKFAVRGNIVRAKGEFILGGTLNADLAQLSPETKYLYSSSSPFMKFYSKGKIRSSALQYFDTLKNEDLDPFFKTHLFLNIFESCMFRPHEWGLKNNPIGPLSIERSIEKVKDMIAGQDLLDEWYKFMSSGKVTKLRKDLVSFYQEESGISYFKEAKFYEKFWKELLASKFVFKGYCTLDDDWIVSSAEHYWGIGKESGLFQIVKRKGKEAMPFTPIMKLDKKLSHILASSRSYSGLKTTDDAQYQHIKKSLPYPFNSLKENE